VIADEDDVDPAEFALRREALARLKMHPRDDEANRAALGGRTCWEDALGETRS